MIVRALPAVPSMAVVSVHEFAQHSAMEGTNPRFAVALQPRSPRHQLVVPPERIVMELR